MRLLLSSGSFLAALSLSLCVYAADGKNANTYTDPASAGPDYQVQGEYASGEGASGWGLQVIALGDGKFDAVLYPGGLPGAGWNGETKYKLSGETKENRTELAGKMSSGSIEGEVFRGKGPDGVSLELKKVERKSPTLGAKPPKGAIVLFDGTSVDQWQNGKLEEGNLLGVGTRTKEKFRDYTLHLEFRTPFMPKARGQGRGNSGMYLNDQYEVQILDSFGLEGKDNECGGIYQAAPPKVNMCLPPLAWQTYDVEMKAARFDESGKKIAPATATVRHNGVVIHDQLEIPQSTPGGGTRDESQAGSLFLQDHGNPVRFRNIWIVPR